MTQNHILMTNGFEDDDDVDSGEEEDETLLYFEGLVRRDERERSAWLDRFSKSLRSWASRSEKKLLSAHLPTALRMAVNSPYRDIRIKMAKILEELEQETKYPVPKPAFEGPSFFIPMSETICYRDQEEVPNTALNVVQELYEEIFIREGRLSNIVQLLGFHPSYLQCFLKTHDFLMHGNGPLPLYMRNYLAILAASRHKCSYVVTMQEAEFLKNGGDISWLQGLQHLPKKMLNLLSVNKTLAHQPWFVSPELVKSLLRGADCWSIGELVHAIVIMTHFHSLASFALGCGINPEIDTQLGHAVPGTTDNTLPFYSNPALGVGGTPSDSDSEPVSPMTRSPLDAQLTRARLQHFIATASSVEEEQNKLTDHITEKLKTMRDSSSSDEESVEQNNLHFEDAASSAGLDSQRPKLPVPTPVSLVKYLEDPSYEHEDFTLSAAVTLRAREYSWDDHAYPFLNSLYPDIGPLLDEKFNLAFDMTYRTCGKENNIDTRHFRQAIWYYILSIKGIRHDDYHYRKVNQLLDISFKTYIRMVACFPEKVTNYDFSNTMSGLQYSEKVHVNILVIEARQQAELIYALRAIMTYMKQQTSQ